MEIVAWIGLAQGLFAATLVLSKRGCGISDKILSGWLFLMAFFFLSTALHYKLFHSQLLSSSFLLFNPALYLYVRSLTEKRFHLKYVQLLHLLPFIVFEILAYLTLENFLPTSYFDSDSNYPFRVAFIIVNLLSWSIYNPLTIMEVHNYRKNLRNEFSNIEKNENIAWVLFISIFYILYCFLLLAIGSIVLFSKIDIPVSQTFNLSSLLVLLYIISYYGIRQKELKILFNPKENNCHASYKNSNLSKEQKSLIRTKLDDILNKDKLYLNPQLSMDILSSALNIPKYQITEVLSTEIGKNFFQYINSYRVNAVTKMLADKSNHYSIDAIGYECGFSSKSSFYTFFRSSTGLTPYEYKLRLQKIEKKK